MKQLLAVFCLVLIVSCGDKKDNVKYLSASSGNLNSISVVADNVIWEGKIGNKIRGALAAPAKGLPQEEPMFSLKQIPTPVFTGFATRSRTIFKVEKGDGKPGVFIKQNVFAKPQTVVVVRGKTDNDIIDLIRRNSPKIIDAFTKREVSEKLRRINKSLLKDEALERALGFTVDIPSVYRIGKYEKDFFWLRKGLSNNKTMDLMFYSYPLDSIRRNDSTVVDIIKMRNKILAFYEAIIDNKPALETRGIWKILDKNIQMAGPFINYAIEDKVNNRYLIAEGYVYAPSLDKREYVFELESIIKSIKIK